MDTEGHGLGESINAVQPAKALHPTHSRPTAAQVRGVVSTRRKAQPTTGATAEYLTAAQIAELLQVSEKSVYRWAAGDPAFPMLKIGGTVRFPRERVLRWLREREQGFGRPRMRKPVLAVTKSGPGKDATSA